MTRSGWIFGATSFAPVPLLLLAVWFGGIWPWLALAYLTLFAFIADELIGFVSDGSQEFPAADRLSFALGIAHFAVFACVLWRFGQGVPMLQGAALFLATGLFFGQISNANAHELIHKTTRFARSLGMWIYISLIFGHHTSAHTLIHHRHVGSENDPNTAKVGEGYYRFALRAWLGSFQAGYQAETQRLNKDGLQRHPYVIYLGGAVACLLGAALIGGAGEALAFLALAVFSQLQLLLSDYVQHYGLQRRSQNGRLEPVNDTHSWNAPHRFTSHMMLNAPRHSAHHTRPSLRFDALDLPEGNSAPMLPLSLPAMSLIALVPPLWRRMMDPRLAYWRSDPLPALAA